MTTRISTLEPNMKIFAQHFCDKLLHHLFFALSFLQCVYTVCRRQSLEFFLNCFQMRLLIPSLSLPLPPAPPPPSPLSSSPSPFVPPFFFLLPDTVSSSPPPLPSSSFSAFLSSLLPLSAGFWCCCPSTPHLCSPLCLINMLIHTPPSPSPSPFLSHLLAFKPLSLGPEGMQKCWNCPTHQNERGAFLVLFFLVLVCFLVLKTNSRVTDPRAPSSLQSQHPLENGHRTLWHFLYGFSLACVA